MLAAACGIGWSTAGVAQSGPPRSSPPPGASGGPGPGNSGQPPQSNDSDQSQNEGGQQIPVLAVTAVEVLRGSQSPTSDVVRVRGIGGTKGWSNAALFPITQGTPSDGILDLVLVATPPSDHAPQGFDQIEAILPVDTGHPYKGVRVRSANNAVTVKTLPGSAQAKGPSEDCSKCVGKHFVAKGAAAPGGVAVGDIVKQDDLPANVRIIRPTDGIGDMQSDPNRLTLVIGDDGKIVDAAWD
jgi:hypothetical protein